MDVQEVKYARSSGPGGQHVNKTESKVDLRVQIDHIQLPPEVSARQACTLLHCTVLSSRLVCILNGME